MLSRFLKRTLREGGSDRLSKLCLHSLRRRGVCEESPVRTTTLKPSTLYGKCALQCARREGSSQKPWPQRRQYRS